MEWYWITHAVVGVLLGCIPIYLDAAEEGSVGGETIGASVAVLILWPLILAVAIICSPFYGAFLLGEKQHQKKEAAKKAKKVIAEHERQQWAEIETAEQEPFDERMDRARRRAIGKLDRQDMAADMRDAQWQLELRMRKLAMEDRNNSYYLRHKNY